MHELLDDVVGIVRVADGVRGPQQHLEQDVGNPLAQVGQPLPGAFLEEPHRRVERRPAPHLEREQLAGMPGVGVGDLQHVVRAHPRRQQRLMRVAERRVGDQQRLLLAHPLAELLGAQLLAACRACPAGSAACGRASGTGAGCAARGLGPAPSPADCR